MCYKIYPREYSEYVEKYSAEFGVPESIIYAVIKAESNFNKNVVSTSGAIGLMQLMENTAVEAGDKIGEEVSVKSIIFPKFNL